MKQRQRSATVLGVAALLTANLALASAPADAQSATTPAFVPGSGAASASVARARLFYGGLSLPIGIGTASASYTNQQSRALGVAMDFGAYVGLAGDVPEQFTPVVIDSNEGDRTATGNAEAGEVVAQQDLKATRVPLSSSEVRMTDLDLPALVRVEGAHAGSTSEVREGKQRRAAAFSEIGRITIAGLVTLDNVRWEVEQRTGFEAGDSATFSIGNASIAGLKVPIAGADLNSGLSTLNNTLKPVGLRIEAPKKATSKEGGVSMSPMRVALANSQLGEQLLGPIIASARPLLAPVLDTVTDANSTLGLAGLVADIVLGVADGSGGVELTLGGATAITTANGFVAPTLPDNTPSSSPATLPNTSLGGSSPLTGVTSPVAPIDESVLDSPVVAATQSLKCALEAAPRRQGDCRSGNLLAAILISGVAVVGIGAAEFGVRRRRTAAVVTSDEVAA